MTALTTRLDETIRSEMARNRIPGLAIALVRHDEVVLAEGYGIASIESDEPVTPEMRFSIQSVTKPITVSAMMQLRDAGHFQLDDPANKHLAPVAAIANEFEAESPVTIRQLMTHSAGLPVALGVAAPKKLSLAEYVSTFARTTQRPGTEIVYANLGFDAMGVMIENFSGQRVDEYLRDHIFAQLGMASTELANPADDARHATGHYISAVDRSLRTLPVPDWPTIPATPAGGGWSNVLDLSRFLIAHLNNGEGILEIKSAQEMHDPHFLQAGHTGQGLGFRVTRCVGDRLICHGGDGSGFTAFIAGNPGSRTGVVLLQNCAGMQSSRSIIGSTALQALAGDSGPRSFPGTQPLPQGEYKSTFWDITIEANTEALITTDGLIIAGQQDESTLHQTRENTYEGHGGMFHGFELIAEGNRFYGGVYPFTFVRTGDLTATAPVDGAADLAGTWSGTSQTPLGPLALTITVAAANAGTIDTPFAQGLALADFSARNGRLAAEFSMQVPGVGAMQMLLRLECRDGRLSGKTYARTSFGEIAMPTELDRA